MNEILLSNLTNVGFAVLLFIISYIANISLSLFYNVKINNEGFDKTKLITGLIKMFSVALGVALLAITITLLPIFLNHIGINIQEGFIESFSIITIISLFVNSIYKYIKEAYETLNNILNQKK